MSANPPNGKPQRARAMSQLLEIQDQLHAACMDPNVKKSVKAACARAWSELEERKRILRGIPLPDTIVRLDPAELARRMKKRNALRPPKQFDGPAFIEVAEHASDPEPGKTEPQGISLKPERVTGE